MTMNRMAVTPMTSIMVDLLCLGDKTSILPDGGLVDDQVRQGDVRKRQYCHIVGERLARSNFFRPLPTADR